MHNMMRRFIPDDIEEKKPREPEERLFLSEKKLRFVTAWSGNLIAAAQAAGYSHPKVAAYKLMKDPEVVKALQKKQESMLQESGEQFARTIPLSRADVIERLWELAQIPPQSTKGTITGQVKAAQALEEVFALNIDRNEALKRQLHGKSDAELEFFVIHGFLPHHEEKPGLDSVAEAPQLLESTAAIESIPPTAGDKIPELHPAEVAEPAAQ